jgi:hypothetical protein
MAASLFLCSSFSNDRLIPAISRLVTGFCRVGLGDLDTSRFYMAAHELAENVTKYSTTSRGSLEVELSERDGAHTLCLKTRNQATPAQLAEVTRRLDELKRAPDPMALYDRIIEQSAPIEGVSGLGLARIRAEGGFEFEYAIEGDELTLVASTEVAKSERP